MDINYIVNKQRDYFKSGITKDINFRINNLKLLKKAILKYEDQLLHALKQDMGKPLFEAYSSEIGLVINEIDNAILNTKRWSKAKGVRTPILLIPGSSYIYPEPLGVALIISPWNYPVQLSISPLVGAIAAGNCCIVKPSEYSINVTETLINMFDEFFNEQYIKVMKCSRKESDLLLKEKFDYIFFTGGAAVGRIVMEAAAKNLTPLTLELGGKNPCIVDKNTNLDITARRIVKGKFFNAGQTCVAPDYILVDKSIKKELVLSLEKHITLFYGENPRISLDYARIINIMHFDRLTSLLNNTEIVYGGNYERSEKYISPTIIDNPEIDSALMKDEIFGPILPIFEYDSFNECIDIVNNNDKPLALYLFSNDKYNIKKILNSTSSGGVCINDTIDHIITSDLPFGGVGESGMGGYHGKKSFDIFSHYKSVLEKGFALDFDIKYPPYKVSLKNLKKLIKFLK